MNQQDDYFQDEKAFRSILLNDTDPFLGVCDLSGHEFSLYHCDLEEFDSEQSTSDESTEYDFHLDQGLAPFKFEKNLDDGNLEFLIEGCMENWNCATQAIESFTGSEVPKVEEDPLGNLTDASSEPEQTAFDSILEELDGEIFLSQLDTRREWDTQAPVRKEAREGSLHANNQGPVFERWWTYPILLKLVLLNLGGAPVKVKEIYDAILICFTMFEGKEQEKWKRNIRHTLNESSKTTASFLEKTVVAHRKHFMYAMREGFEEKIRQQLQRVLAKHRDAIRLSMYQPQNIEELFRGTLGF